jgi:hypothetical protein
MTNVKDQIPKFKSMSNVKTLILESYLPLVCLHQRGQLGEDNEADQDSEDLDPGCGEPSGDRFERLKHGGLRKPMSNFILRQTQDDLC